MSRWPVGRAAWGWAPRWVCDSVECESVAHCRAGACDTRQHTSPWEATEFVTCDGASQPGTSEADGDAARSIAVLGGIYAVL